MQKILDIIIGPTTVLAALTFLWYRKGRLWNFYDTLLSKSIEQIKTNSLDRRGWEEIALEQCSILSGELFNSLFRFEIEYLKDKIIKNQYNLRIADSEEDSDREITYTDKEKFCKHNLEQTFLSDFRFCGFGLFIKAVKKHWICKRNDKDPGYVEIRKTK
jgi:hypothetical protein